MRTFIFISLLFSSVFCIAQTPQQIAELNSLISDGKCEEAEKIINTLDIENSRDKNSPLVLTNLAICFVNNYPDKAIVIAQKALILNQKLENSQPNITRAIILQNLGNSYYVKHDDISAEKFYHAAVLHSDSLNNFPPPLRKSILKFWCATEKSIYKSIEGVKYYDELFSLHDPHSLDNSDKLFIAFLYNYYETLQALGRKENRIDIQNKILSFVSENFGHDASYYELLIKYGTDHLALGDAELGKNRLNEGLLFFLSQPVVNNKQVSYAYYGLSIFEFYKQDNINAAEKNILNAIAYFESPENSNSNYWIQLYGTYASILAKKNEFGKAEFYFQKNKHLIESKFGTEHTAYLSFIILLSEFYKQQNNKFEAEKLLREGVLIAEKTNNKAFISTFNSQLSSTIDVASNINETIKICERAIENNISFYGENSKEVVSSYDNLLFVFHKAKRIKEFENLLEKQSSIINKFFANDIPLKVKIVENTYLLNQLKWGDKRMNDGQYEVSLKKYQNEVIKLCSKVTPETIEKAILPFFITSSNINKKLIYDSVYQRFLLDLNSSLYNYELVYKGLIPKVVAQFKENLLLLRNNGKFDEKISNFLETQSRIYNSSSQNSSKTLNEREKYILLEREIYGNLPDNKFLDEILDVSATKLSNEIESDVALLEFFTTKVDNDNWLCIAMIKQNTKPEIFYLSTEQEIEDLLKSKGQIGSLNSINDFYKDSALYELIWKPLQTSLEDINKVYYAPAGGLHKIAFSAITSTDGKTLSERYNLKQVTSTREVLDGQFYGVDKTSTIALFGGINYDADSVELSRAKGAIAANNEHTYSIKTRDATISKFTKLPFAENEVKAIAKNFSEQNTKLFVNSTATEEQLKKLGDYSSKSPTILHIATHGFYFEDLEIPQTDLLSAITFSEKIKQAENPLLRSGLVLAGANHVWQGNKPYKGLEDGILTAQEVANLNLTNTKLVVLSACESGLGDIKNNSEGVYGLQRAFKMAGVEYLLVSLWSVDDYTTQKMMRTFYSNLTQGKSIEDSYQEMVNTTKKQYPNEPSKWASFVLIK